MIQNSSMLVDLNISAWTGRKMDKKVSEEIDASKNTKAKAGNYNKKLLAGTHKLEEVSKLVGLIRLWHYEQTLPWSDSGSRLLPMKNFFDYKAQLSTYEGQFKNAVASFIQEYPTLVSAAAFQLGDLFDSTEYPDVNQLQNKFKFRYVFLPVPEVGDFRIDVNEESKQELRTQYEEFYNGRLNDAMQEAWARLHDCVTHLSDRLADAEKPRDTKEGPNYTKLLRESLITNANELCDLLTKLNITGDPKLEQARAALEATVNGLDIKDLRDSDALRNQTKAKVDQILSMF